MQMKKLEKTLFDNSGRKIQKLAKILFRVGAAISIIAGIVTIIVAIIDISNSPWNSDIGLLIILCGVVGAALGCLFSWISSVVLYGFGKIVEKAEEKE